MSAVLIAYIIDQWRALPDRWLILSLVGGIVASGLAVLA
jgi:hypothetical protein